MITQPLLENEVPIYDSIGEERDANMGSTKSTKPDIFKLIQKLKQGYNPSLFNLYLYVSLKKFLF